MDGFLIIALIESTYRSSNFLKLKLFTDFPDKLQEGKTVFLDFFNEPRPFEIEEAISEGSIFVVHLKNFDTPDVCEELIGKYIYIPEVEKTILPDDSYYIHDLIGSQVLTSDGVLGEIIDVMVLPANDVYIVKQG